jgi:HECT-domain (ubiquitin-transferase)
VTKERVEEYCDLLVDWYLNESIKKQYQNFANGFYKVVDLEKLQMFTGAELQICLVGYPSYDFKELEKTARYADGYTKESPVIK